MEYGKERRVKRQQGRTVPSLFGTDCNRLIMLKPSPQVCSRCCWCWWG